MGNYMTQGEKAPVGGLDISWWDSYLYETRGETWGRYELVLIIIPIKYRSRLGGVKGMKSMRHFTNCNY